MKTYNVIIIWIARDYRANDGIYFWTRKAAIKDRRSVVGGGGRKGDA